MEQGRSEKIVVLGATGYVGGRLVSRLLELGYQVRATARSADKLKSRYWANHRNVTLSLVDIHDPQSLRQSLEGMDIAYYLVHSMNPQSKDFEKDDRMAARNMVTMSKECGIKRIIYLSGLGEDADHLSKHLRSRHEVAEILRSGPVPVTVLRAAMIIGSGSASFEILRYLVERLPVMITPRWVKTPNQPIAIRNVIGYLVGCIEKEETTGEVYDIGGKQILSYMELMQIYAKVAGLKRRIFIPVPVLTPRLSSLWIHLITPVPGYIARPLTEGLKNPVICKDNRIREIIPQELLDCQEAISKALDLFYKNDIKTHWTDAGSLPHYDLIQPGDPSWAGGTILQDQRQQRVKISKKDLWRVIEQIGGNSQKISAGDVLDFGRVVDVKENEQLVLAVEMKLPGQAVLSFKIRQVDPNTCELTQHAIFRPHGLAGLLTWYFLIPFHKYIFGGMINKIIIQAKNRL